MRVGILLVHFLVLACLLQAALAQQPIKGGVVKIQVTLNDLRDARLAVSRARKAAANLYDEVTRQEMTMYNSANVVGTTVITVPTPMYTGQILPARTKWVRESMDDIGPIETLLKEDVDRAEEEDSRTDVSDEAKKELAPLREEAFAAVKISYDLYKQLEGLTVGPTYDNQAIAETVKALDAKLKELDRELKKGIVILQKEQRASKKTKSS